MPSVTPPLLPCKNMKNKGFSLVELAIVLVILGLLTGGVLTGQSLIRAAELRSVSQEYSRYTAATQTFRDKYLALPGDMSNATRFWLRTVNAAHCVTNSTAAVGTPGTCDGDGDGIIDLAPAALQSGERFQFWNQLADAGLIEGSYTGFASSISSVDHDITNAPPGKLSNSGWFSVWLGVQAAGANFFDGDYGNALYLALYTGGTSIMTPEEIWNIDTKMDDGRPATGFVVVRERAGCTNATAAVADSDNFDSVYSLTSTATACAIVFKGR